MEIRQATQKDWDYVLKNPFEGSLKYCPHRGVPEENAYAVIYEGQLVAVGGLQMSWPGKGLLWLMLTADCKKDGRHGVLALSAIKDKVDELIEKNNLWRAEATVRTDFPQAIKMIEYLGFERESTMKKYMPDKGDAYLYVKVQ